MTDYKTVANSLEAELKKLDAEAREGVDDAIWLYERTEKIALRAIEVIRLQAAPVPEVNPDHRADHDSLFARFEQLDGMLERFEYAALIAATPRGIARLKEIRQLVALIRAQVLK